MKIKSDFVTNSSSSSFVVIGVNLQQSEITSMQRGPEPEDVYELLDPLLKGSDLAYSSGCDYSDDSVMIGIYYTNMKDDETLKDFKARVQKQLLETLGVDKEPGHIEECWMDN